MSTAYFQMYSVALIKSLGKLLLQPKSLRCQLETIKRSLSLLKLAKTKRYTPVVTELLGNEIELVDSDSFLAMYGEILDKEIYKFKAETETPTIIDGGANIGISVLYFKHLYPHSHIVAFEPDRKIFQVLQKNIQ